MMRVALGLVLGSLSLALVETPGPERETLVATAAETRRLHAGSAAVSIKEFAFTPDVIEVTTGDTVTWVNYDALRHATTSDSSAWSSTELARGERFTFVAGKPGRYGYHCSAHPVMRGTLVVR